MGSLETSKRRASRIPLDYFKHRNLWERRKIALALAAAVAAGAWWTSSALLGRQADLHSPGPLASVHQTWNNDCNACHTDFQPASSDSVAARWQGGTPATDQKCAHCHTVLEHNPKQIKAETPGCASCHREHQGIGASLVRIDDRSCTQCHASLAEHTAPKTTAESMRPTVTNVTRFDKDHPKFRSLASDPGRIKFSHYVHMMPGVHADGQADKHPMTFADISDPAQRERYRRPGQRDDAIVQLDCNSCHGAAGAYMSPIQYDNQCIACHAIEYEAGNAATSLTHRQTPAQLHRAIESAYAAEFLRGNPELLDKFVPPHPLPNQLPTEDESARKRIEERVTLAERRLDQAVCGKCHYPAADDSRQLRAVRPANLPTVWLQNAHFDHHAHRAIDCRACHAGAYPDSATPSKTAADVMIPQIDVCLQCHAPRDVSTASPRGGARIDCVECHRYHSGASSSDTKWASPHAGSGALGESPAKKMGVEQFHRGGALDPQ